MTRLQIKIIHLCIAELESTLGSMPSNEADNVVREVKEVLSFVVDSEEE